MAEANFEKLRENLSGVVKEAWKADKDDIFRNALKAIFGKAAVAKYMECTTDTTKDFYECLRDAADELGVGDKMRTAWRTAPTDLKTKLRDVRGKWSDAERDVIRAAVRGADIPRLYKMCAYGKYSEIATELKLDTTPAHFKDCVRAVAAEKDLESTLMGIWGTA